MDGTSKWGGLRMRIGLRGVAVPVVLGMAVLGMVVLGVAVLVNAQSTEFMALPAGASVRIVEPADGATVRSPVKVVFSVSGATIKPAGAPEAGTGHHHLLIDTGPTPEGVVIGADATHLHFGKGQTETTVELKPGEHTLTLQFADGLHRSYGPKMSHSIQIAVPGT